MHRRAAALMAAVDAVLAARRDTGTTQATERPDPEELADRLRTAAGELAPGWLGASLEQAPLLPLGAAAPPAFVRVGRAALPDGASFPVVVPLGHLTYDTAARHPRVAGNLRATLLRMLAGAAPGSVLVRMVDPAGAIAGVFTDLQPPGIVTPPVTDRDGLDRVLTEAEQWAAAPPDSRHLVVVLAGWPGPATRGDIARVASLAASARQLHLFVADWPPVGHAADLPGATRVRLRPGGVLVGHPPAGTVAAPGAGSGPLTDLAAAVTLDEVPPPVVREVCVRVARQRREEPRIRLAELLRHVPGQDGSLGRGPEVTLGRAGRTPVTLRLGVGTWHWLVGGHCGSGKTALLYAILFGLVNRYGPDQLAIQLVDPVGDGFPADLADLAHVRGLARGPAQATALLRETADRADVGPPRVVCLLDGLHALDDDGLAAVRSLASDGPALGVHLVLAGDGAPPQDLAALCTVRIALPGGQVLDGSNDAATGLAVGSAIVNTASGLGGPRGATRAHERLVRFPDPRTEPTTLAGLHRRLARAGGAA